MLWISVDVCEPPKDGTHVLLVDLGNTWPFIGFFGDGGKRPCAWHSLPWCEPMPEDFSPSHWASFQPLKDIEER